MTPRADIWIIQSLERGDVEVSDGALALMAACINEALEAVGGWEFSIRIGFTVDEARDLKRQIESIIEERGGSRHDRKVVLDTTRDRVKPVVPGQGFVAEDGRKLAPTQQQLDWINQLWGN